MKVSGKISIIVSQSNVVGRLIIFNSKRVKCRKWRNFTIKAMPVNDFSHHAFPVLIIHSVASRSRMMDQSAGISPPESTNPIFDTDFFPLTACFYNQPTRQDKTRQDKCV